MNTCDAADADSADAMCGYRRVGAHCMRYVEFVPSPTAGSWALVRSSNVGVLPEHADRHDRMDISKHDVMLSRLIKCQLPKPSNLVDEIAAGPPLRPLLACCNVPVYITYHTSLSHARAMILFLLPPKFDSVVLF